MSFSADCRQDVAAELLGGSRGGGGDRGRGGGFDRGGRGRGGGPMHQTGGPNALDNLDGNGFIKLSKIFLKSKVKVTHRYVFLLCEVLPLTFLTTQGHGQGVHHRRLHEEAGLGAPVPTRRQERRAGPHRYSARVLQEAVLPRPSQTAPSLRNPWQDHDDSVSHDISQV